MYEHLSRMSFSFYDRVQSGQLISRANSDIRSVQMYLAFAPIDPRAVQRRRPRVRGDAVDQRAARARRRCRRCRSSTSSACGCGKQMFPVSWLIQSRLADVATVVDENINGVRVVKSFAAEDHQLQHLTGAATRAEWANVEGRRHPGAAGRPLHREPAPPRPGARAASTAATSPSTARRRSATSSRSTPTC